jgi:hypothetical protein
MPTLKNYDVYKRAFDVTYDLLSGAPAELLNPEITLKFPKGTPMYRYSPKKISDGGESNARKVWRALPSDTENRWSGTDSKGGGVTGLYLALEAAGALHTEFAELVHYQENEANPDTAVLAYQQYAAGGNPELIFSPVNAIFFMWLFFHEKPLTGINLDVPHAGNSSPFMQRVFMKLAGHSSLGGKTPTQWYLHESDASLCRGIGNACLADHRFDFIRVTSARSADLSAKNIVIPHAGGPATEPYAHLTCHGRSSFFLNRDGTMDAQTSEDDKLYSGRILLD